MKKSLSAVLVILLSLMGAHSLASTIEFNTMKIKIDSEDSTQPGGNRITPNGLKKSKGGE